MRARDAMAPITSRLLPTDGVSRFISLIQEVRAREGAETVRALPVVNPSGYIAGIISMTDILLAMFPASRCGANVRTLPCLRMLSSMSEKVRGMKVSDLMSVPVISVYDTHPLLECAEQMIRYRISALPVVDFSNALLGMLYKDMISSTVAVSLLKGL
jgi:CBS domain-containing protein